MNEEKKERAKRFDASVANCGLDPNDEVVKSVREAYIIGHYDKESVREAIKARQFTGEPFTKDLPRQEREEIRINLDIPKKGFWARLFSK